MSSEEIASAVEQWRSTFEALDVNGLKALWDTSHPRLSYLPTESATILRTWSQISAYYDNICAMLAGRAFRWKTWDLTVDLDESNAWAFADCYFEMESDATYWQGRGSFTFKRRGDTWLLVHYQDSTLYDWMLVPASAFIQSRADAALAALDRHDEAEVRRILAEAAKPVTMAVLPQIPKSDRAVPVAEAG